MEISECRDLSDDEMSSKKVLSLSNNTNFKIYRLVQCKRFICWMTISTNKFKSSVNTNIDSCFPSIKESPWFCFHPIY